MTYLPGTGAAGPGPAGQGVAALATLVLTLGVTAGCTSSPASPTSDAGPTDTTAPLTPEADDVDLDAGRGGSGPGDGKDSGAGDGGTAQAPAARRTEPPPWVTRPRITGGRQGGPGSPGSPGTSDAAQRRFPRPAALGPGWTYRAAFGDPVYVDGPAPQRRLEPREAVRDSVPRGCPRRAGGSSRRASGVPQRAVAMSYEVSGEWVDATRITFGSRRDATAFSGDRRRALAACRGQDGGPVVGPLVTRVQALGPGTTLSDRTPRSDAYSDVSVVDGTSVVVITRRTDERPTLRAARALATAFTGARVPGGLS